MRILVLATLFPPHEGGAPRVVEQFVNRLVSQDHTVEVLTYRAAHWTAEDDRGDGQQPYLIHRVPDASSHRRSLLDITMAALRLSRARRREGAPFDFIVCGMAYPIVLTGRIVSLVGRMPYIAYVHGEDITIIGDSKIKAIALKHALRRARRVLANSGATGLRLVALGLQRDDYEVMPPSIDPTRFATMTAADLTAFTVRTGLDQKRVLLTVATLDRPRKGHDITMEAVGRLADDFSDLIYVVVGGGSTDALREIAASHGVADRLITFDRLSDTDLAALYAAAEIYVMPSRWDPESNEVEGFGIVYLEAAAAGRPSIAGNVGGATEAVLDEHTGLCVDPESVESVARAMRRLLSDPALAERLGNNGRERVRAEFSEEVVLARLDAAVSDTMTP